MQVVLDFQVVIASQDESTIAATQETVQPEALGNDIVEAVRAAAEDPASDLSGLAVGDVVVSKPEVVTVEEEPVPVDTPQVKEEPVEGEQITADEAKGVTGDEGASTAVVARIGVACAVVLIVGVTIAVRKFRGHRARTHPQTDVEVGNEAFSKISVVSGEPCARSPRVRFA